MIVSVSAGLSGLHHWLRFSATETGAGQHFVLQHRGHLRVQQVSFPFYKQGNCVIRLQMWISSVWMNEIIIDISTHSDQNWPYQTNQRKMIKPVWNKTDSCFDRGRHVLMIHEAFTTILLFPSLSELGFLKVKGCKNIKSTKGHTCATCRGQLGIFTTCLDKRWCDRC